MPFALSAGPAGAEFPDRVGAPQKGGADYPEAVPFWQRRTESSHVRSRGLMPPASPYGQRGLRLSMNACTPSPAASPSMLQVIERLASRYASSSGASIWR